MCSCSWTSWILFTMFTGTGAVQSFQNPTCMGVCLLFTATCLFACAHGKYDNANSQLTEIFMCATVNFKTILLEFSYLHVSNYQLSSSPSCCKLCYMFLYTWLNKISKFVNYTYTKSLADHTIKSVRAYRIWKFVRGSYH